MLTSLTNSIIYAEMIKSMGTDSFILALGCFIERPGEVKSVCCDKGSKFISVKRALEKCIKELNHNKISEYLLERRVD